MSHCPRNLPLANFLLAAVMLAILATDPAGAQLLTRQQAATALLDQGSGVPVDPDSSAVWSPYRDYGGGGDREGLLMGGSVVRPEIDDFEPFPGGPVTLADDFYFFWIDDLQQALFTHPVRFVLVNAVMAQPTVANGGIVVSVQGWWPIIESADGQIDTLFAAIEERVTDLPAGYDNPEGLVLGRALAPGDLLDFTPSPTPAAARVPTSSACALVANLYKGKTFLNDIKQYEDDLINRLGVPPERIVRAAPESNPDHPGSKQNFCDAIDTLAAWADDCDCLYIRISTHGAKTGLKTRDGKLTKKVLCEKLQKVAAKGKPMKILINACFSGALIDDVGWNLPAGSSIITAADDEHEGWGDSTFRDPQNDDEEFTGSIYTRAFSRCLRDPAADADGDGQVNDCEAHDWVLARHPCYEWVKDGKRYYPAGPPDGVDSDTHNPNPQKHAIGNFPTLACATVCNGTDEPKTDFHLILKGDVRDPDAMACAWRSDEIGGIGDILEHTWAADGVTVTYNEEKNETMVCWEDLEDPILPGQYCLFAYYRQKGGLRTARQYWTPTPEDPAPADRLPEDEGSIHPSDDGAWLNVKLITRNLDQDGWDVPVMAETRFRVSPVMILPEHLNLGDPQVQALPVIEGADLLLIPGQAQTLQLAWGVDIQPSEYLIVEQHLSWNLNPMGAIKLMEFAPLRPLPTAVDQDAPQVARRLLNQNFPNPFNPRTTLRFELPRAGRIDLRILDLTGRLVATLADGVQPAGPGISHWLGSDARGRPVGAGTYLARLSFEGRTETVKVMLIR